MNDKESMKCVEEFLKCLDGDLTINLVLIVSENETYTRLKINITKEIKDDLFSLLKKKLERTHSEFVDGDKVIEEYDPSDKDQNIYRIIEERQVEFKDTKNDLENVQNLQLAKLDTKLLSKLWAYAIVIRNKNNDELSYFIKYKPTNALSKDKWLKWIINDSQLSNLNQNILLLPKSIAAIYFNGKFLIFNKYYFEQIFRFIEAFKKNATKLLEYFPKFDFKIDGFNEFKKQCNENPLMIRKLNNIYVKNNYTSLDFDALKKMKKDFKLTLDLKEDKKGNQVIFNNKREFWQLLNFLEDDYLSSPTTKINYEVHSKREISR